MKRTLMSAGTLLALVAAGCSTDSPSSTSTSLVMPTGTTIVTVTSMISVPDPLPVCPRAPYQVGVLPVGAFGGEEVPLLEVEINQYTDIEGTDARIWVGEDGKVAVALVRGALPPITFEADVGEILVDGTPGVAGQVEDGTWVAAWIEEPQDRCDRYFMVFVQPVEPGEVKATLESLRRIR